MTSAKSAIPRTVIFVMNTSPPFARNMLAIESLAASLLVITKRVIAGSDNVSGPPPSICVQNKGITEPRDPATFPNRTDEKTTLWLSLRRALAAVTRRSPMSFEVPITFVGLTALSELVKRTLPTRCERAAAA